MGRDRDSLPNRKIMTDFAAKFVVGHRAHQGAIGRTTKQSDQTAMAGDIDRISRVVI
jgi:hypothetical protein